MKITDHVYSVGVKAPDYRLQGLGLETPNGTTFNAYLVRGEKTALIETVPQKYSGEWIKNIEAYVPVSEIDYVILNHAEPDHSTGLLALLERNSDIKVVGTIASLKNLKELTNETFSECLAKDGDSLDLGDGVTLRFLITPNLPWPDTMMTYLSKDAVLFSCDFLSAHVLEDDLFDNSISDQTAYQCAFREYFHTFFRPFKSFVRGAIDRIESLELQSICTGHGPILQTGILDGIQQYKAWCVDFDTQKTIAIFYGSIYGATEKIAKTLQTVLEEQGSMVHSFDVAKHSMTEMAEVLNRADAILIGAATIRRNAIQKVWELLSYINVFAVSNKPIGIFGSYGWSGEAGGNIASLLKAMKLEVFESPLKIAFTPSKADLDTIRDYAMRFFDKLDQ